MSKSGIMRRPGLTIGRRRRDCPQRVVRAAALELGMSTTALSNVIGKLEAHFGVRLFNRTTCSVPLSDAGRLFVERVGVALQDIHGAMQAACSQQAIPSGTLRINSYANAAREILSPLVLEFAKRFPEVHIDLVTEGRLPRHRCRGSSTSASAAPTWCPAT